MQIRMPSFLPLQSHIMHQIHDNTLWLRAIMNIMHRMSSFSFVWHWHGVRAHVHLSSHYGIVGLGGLLLKSPTLISVKS